MFEPKNINDSEDFERHRRKGEWRDNTTQSNRYVGYAVALDEKGEYSEDDTLRILDVGSSDGRAIDFLQGLFQEKYGLDTEVVACDINYDALEMAEENDRAEHQVQAAVDYDPREERYLPFQDDSFDMVISKTLLSRLPPEYQSQGLREIERVVSEDGVAGIEIEPEGKDKKGGFDYAFTGEELSELKTQTENFEEYDGLKGLLEPNRAVNV